VWGFREKKPYDKCYDFFFLLELKNQGQLYFKKNPGPSPQLASFVCGLMYVASAFRFFFCAGRDVLKKLGGKILAAFF